MPDYNEFTSGFGIPHLGSGFNDIVAFVFDSPRETSINATADSIDAKNILETKSFNFTINQKSVSGDRYAGEGADQSMLSIGNVSLSASLTTPLFQSQTGWVTPIFATLWDRTKLSWWGTAGACKGNLITNASSGSTYLETDNISDFASLPTPFNLNILTDTETPETVIVSSVTKSTRRLNLSGPTTSNHTASATTLSCLPYNLTNGPVREPAFSLMSLREGMLSPCLVNKMTITANAGEPVQIEMSFKALNIYRDRQMDMNGRKQELISNAFSIHDPNRIINGTMVRLSLSSYNSGNFGLPTALGDQIVAGFQGLQINDFTITGVTLTIENQLKEIYTSHSINRDVQLRRRENTYPYALASEGRIISGKIRYRSPIDFWSNFEKIAGPSSINGGGLSIDFGSFSITMNEIAWEPSTSEGNMTSQSREISFTMIAENRNSMPVLDFSQQG